MKKLEPIHPGIILKEEFLDPNGLTFNQLALEIGVTVGRIFQIVEGKRGISKDTAYRLGKYFKTGSEFWFNLMKAHYKEMIWPSKMSELGI